MRVLHVTAGNLYGGVETYLVTLARCRHLCPEMVPEFAVCFPGRLRDEVAAEGVPVHDMGPVRISRPWTVLRARRRLRRLLRGTPFGAVVAHSSWPHAVFAPAVRRAGVRLAHVVHGEVDLRHWLNRWAARTRPDVVVANSQFIAGQAARLFPGVPSETVYYPVVPPAAIDPVAARQEVRTAFGTPADAVVILQVSRLEPWKGQALHLEALARLKDLLGWEAWFVGGPQKAGEAEFLADLRAAVNRAGIAARVRFLGQRADVPRLMAAADVFCQPNSGPEPFGIVFVEALYAGRPVVSTDFGGAAEVVTPECGVLVPPGNAAAVAAALADLIRNPARRPALGAAGRVRAEVLCDPARQLRRLAKVVDGTAGPPGWASTGYPFSSQSE